MNSATKIHYARPTTNVAHYLFIALCAAFPVALGAANVLLVLCAITCVLATPWRTIWPTIRLIPAVWAIIALSTLITIGVLYTSAPSHDWQLHLKKYIKIPLIILWIALLINNVNAIRLSWVAFTISMAFIAASTWANVWLILPWSATKVTGWGISHHVFGDYITQNVMMSLFVLWLLLQAQQSHGLQRYFWLISATLSALTITHLSQGRTGYVLLAVSLLIFTITRYRGKTLVYCLTASFIALALLMTTSDTMSTRFREAIAEAQRHEQDPHSSIGHRIFNYKITPNLIKEKPVFGWGTGSYHTIICNEIPDNLTCSEYNWHPHNQYLFFGVEHGLLGIFAYVAFFVCMILIALRTPRHSQAAPLLLGLTALLAVDSLFNSPLWSARESHFFTIMAGLLIAMAHTERSPRSMQG